MEIRVFDIEILKDISCLKKHPVIFIYGAGGKGTRIHGLLKQASISTFAFCDMDSGKWNHEIDGAPVLSPIDFQRTAARLCADPSEKRDIYYLCCVERPAEAFTLLRALMETRSGSGIRCVSYWAVDTALYIHREELFDANSPASRRLQTDCGYDLLNLARYEIAQFQNLCAVTEKTVGIFQAGKVGSRSIQRMLENANVPCAHCHVHSPLGFSAEDIRSTWEYAQSLYFSRLGKIILAVREPIARDYSAFWHRMVLARGKILSDCKGDIQKAYSLYLSPLYRASGGARANKWLWGDEFLWFDEQILPHFGIDVYQYPFDREKGYGIIRRGSMELFLLKLEKLNDLLPELSDFVEAPLKSVQENAASSSWYSLAYREFRKQARVPAEYVERYYVGNEKMDHFYTPEEKAAFLKQWEGNIARD